MLPYAYVKAAVLDMNLGGPDCSALCIELYRRAIPFLFYTAAPKIEIVRVYCRAQDRDCSGLAQRSSGP